MKMITRIALFFCLTGISAMAETWAGKLVNSDCYSSHTNTNAIESHPASSDMNLRIRQCRPGTSDSTFSIVDSHGKVVPLDSSTNEKVIDLLKQTGRKDMYRVTVTGQMTQNAVRVETILLVKHK
jgi:hypothetical protein